MYKIKSNARNKEVVKKVVKELEFGFKVKRAEEEEPKPNNFNPNHHRSSTPMESKSGPRPQS
jgi:hypothetical protein